MSRTVDDELAILVGTHAWSATPENYSSLRFVVFNSDGTGEVIYGFGQTIYAEITIRFDLAATGTLHLEYLETPQPQRRPPFVPNESNRSKILQFSLTEGDQASRESVIGFNFQFGWTLEFAESPYPDGLSFPYSIPTIFHGYRKLVGDGLPPAP